MEISQLRYFRHVAQTEKISDSAEALFISPSALSTSIARLEKELGVKLFDRIGNRIQLNAQGRIFLRYVDQVFTSLNCAKIELAQSLDATPRHLRIAVMTSHIWAPLFSAFSKENPDILITSTTLPPADLNAGEVLRQYSFLLADNGDSTDESCNALFLFEDEPLLMVHPRHPLAKETSVNMQVLNQERLILPMQGHSFHRRLVELLKAHNVTPANIYECPYAICRSMAEDGVGVSFSTAYTLRFEKKGNCDLCYVPIRPLNCSWKQLLCWHKARILTPEEQRFQEFVIRFCRDGQI